MRDHDTELYSAVARLDERSEIILSRLDDIEARLDELARQTARHNGEITRIYSGLDARVRLQVAAIGAAGGVAAAAVALLAKIVG